MSGVRARARLVHKGRQFGMIRTNVLLGKLHVTRAAPTKRRVAFFVGAFLCLGLKAPGRATPAGALAVLGLADQLPVVIEHDDALDDLA